MEYAIVGVVLLVALALISMLTRWLWFKGRYGRIFLAVGFLVVTWSIYDAVYPSESFYVSELEALIKVTLPPDAQFLYKTATYPDIHGDYSACFIVRLPDMSMNTLKTSLAAYPVQETKTSGCTNTDKSSNPLNTNASRYNLSEGTTRKDAEIFIDLIPNQNLAVVSWFTW